MDAVHRWAGEVAASRPEVRRIGYFGSYARGDAGVGSDVDLVVIVDRCEEPWERRTLRFDATDLPVPADVLVYTEEEWGRLRACPGLVRTVDRDAIWVVSKA